MIIIRWTFYLVFFCLSSLPVLLLIGLVNASQPVEEVRYVWVEHQAPVEKVKKPELKEVLKDREAWSI